MGSGFEAFRKLSPSTAVIKAIVAATVLDAVLLAFILVRRTYRKWYFAKRDARVFAFRQNWDALTSGKTPFASWRTKPFERRIVEAMVLDAFELAQPEESARLLRFLRASGLIEKMIFDAQHHVGWRRQRALVALGRTRAAEGIAALSEALRDRTRETRLAALRGLERMACPEAGRQILNWIGEAGIQVPALPLQSALIQCCAERPQILLPYLEHGDDATRELLGRVLGEVATASLAPEMLRFTDDRLAELRAAAARALAQTEPKLAIDVLSDLARDSVWFVRLRAVVSLGKLGDAAAVTPLLESLCDSNRLVRFRAAEALVTFNHDRLAIFQRVVAFKDRYALHAYLAAIDNACLQQKLEEELQLTPTLPDGTRQLLAEVLRAGSLPPEPGAPQSASAAMAAR
jgi:HEAT repeat protein